MGMSEGQTTDRGLLVRLGDWADQVAWTEFVRRYDPEIRRYCRGYRFDAEALEELCQRIWVELARRLRTYRYDPSRRFRWWLRSLCRSRSIDFWRQRRAEFGRLGDAAAMEAALGAVSIEDDRESCVEEERLALLDRAEGVQTAVRRRVDAATWDVFWRIAVMGETVGEVAESAGVSYAAAFASQSRVRRMLREEARRLSGAMSDGGGN